MLWLALGQCACCWLQAMNITTLDTLHPLAATTCCPAGKMELFSVAFYPAVLAVLDNQHLVAFGSVPVARYGRTIPQVHYCWTDDAHKLLPVGRLAYIGPEQPGQVSAATGSGRLSCMQQLTCTASIPCLTCT